MNCYVSSHMAKKYVGQDWGKLGIVGPLAKRHLTIMVPGSASSCVSVVNMLILMMELAATSSLLKCTPEFLLHASNKAV